MFLLKKQQNQFNKGFLSFDCLLSVIPQLICILILFNVVNYYSKEISENIHDSQNFDKLVIVSDFLIKSELALKIGSTRIPNYLTPEKRNGPLPPLASYLGFNSLEYSRGIPPQNSKNCIYRIMVANPEKEITKIYVCGE